MDVVNKPVGYSDFNRLYWVGIPLTLLLFIITLILYTELKQSEFRNLQLHMADAATITINPIQNSFENYIEMINRLGKRWELAGGMPKPSWVDDANNLYRDTEIFYTIEWVNPNMQVSWIVPASMEAKYAGLDLSKIPTRHEALLLAQQTKKTTVSKIVNLVNGPKGLLIIYPLFLQSGFGGYMLGVVDIAKLFNQLFKNGLGEGYGMAIYQDGMPVYATASAIANPFLVIEKTVKVYNVHWQFYLWPTELLLEKMMTPLPAITLFSGTLIAALILIAFFFYDKSLKNTSKMLNIIAQADEAARGSQIILHSVNEGFISIDHDSNITDWNPYAEKIFGWKKEAVMGKKIYDVIIPERFRNAHQVGLKKFLESGEQRVFNKPIEVSAIRQNNTEFPVELIIFPLYLKGKYTFHSFVRDITERKIAETDSARFATMVDSSDDAIISMDLDGRVLTWNKGAEKMYGYLAVEMVGKPIAILHPPDQQDELQDMLARLHKGHHIQNHDTMRKNKSGALVPVSIMISPIKNKEGEIIGASSIARDIAERKHVEKMKNEFISIVSHELRTPLTSIRGSIGILASGKICPLTDKAQQLLEIANNNCDRLIRLINDILDIEKIEAGRMDFNLKLCNLNTLIKDAIDANLGMASKHNVKLEFKADDNYEVTVDADRITQVITNLLSNAIRYSPLNGIVKVQLTNMLNKVRISVIDNGPGIPKEFQQKMFGKFRQADSSDTRQKSGTGLGLNISQAIVEKHHSSIGFLTTQGRGSTFYFDLLISSKTGAHPELLETHKKILICDANQFNAEYLKTLMQKKNIDADIAHSAPEARTLIGQNNYAAITVDLQLPDSQDVQFIRELREQAKTSYLPIVVLATDAKEQEKLYNAKGFPAVDWLEKPSSQDQTKRILDYINTRFTTKSAKILSVEDDGDVTRIISIMLQEKASVWNANTIAKAKKLLREHEFDVVILDLNLPDGSGTELLPCINFKTKLPVPVIVFSIDELSKNYTHLVKSTLLKSIVTNEQLYEAIQSAINPEKTYT